VFKNPQLRGSRETLGASLSPRDVETSEYKAHEYQSELEEVKYAAELQVLNKESLIGQLNVANNAQKSQSGRK